MVLEKSANPFLRRLNIGLLELLSWRTRGLLLCRTNPSHQRLWPNPGALRFEQMSVLSLIDERGKGKKRVADVKKGGRQSFLGASQARATSRTVASWKPYRQGLSPCSSPSLQSLPLKYQLDLRLSRTASLSSTLFRMNCEKELAENPIIQGLEALLRSDEPEHFNTRRVKTNETPNHFSWKENSELSRDSVFGFSNASFKSRHTALHNLEAISFLPICTYLCVITVCFSALHGV